METRGWRPERGKVLQLLKQNRERKVDVLLNLLIVLGGLLIVLAVIALFGQVLALMDRFRSQIFLFAFGALLAYLMVPLVRLLQRGVRRRWAAVLSAYLLLFLTLIVFGILFINPFISQARSLVDELHQPSTSSIVDFQQVPKGVMKIRSDLEEQHALVSSNQPVPAGSIRATQNDISTLQRELSRLSAGNHAAGQMRVPPSYIDPIVVSTDQLQTQYTKAMASPSVVNGKLLNSAILSAEKASSAASDSYHKEASTPILLLNLQVWMDQHGIKVDLHDKFGAALEQASSQASSLVDNALSVALQAGNLLLNTVLILLISIYFIADGARFINWLVRLLPASNQEEGRYFVGRLDGILGAYLRTQVLLALLAGFLAAIGAVVLGVPYAAVIFLLSFLLSLIPVIGPVILPFPPTLIAIIFTPLPRALIYLGWLLVAMQIATNVIGPRVQGQTVGIHPLEAMAAALLGFPIAGFLGSFFAVPTVAFLHIVVREIRHVQLEGQRSQADAVTPPAQEAAASPSGT
jgi:predicted PurR-regulated permease PerM